MVWPPFDVFALAQGNHFYFFIAVEIYPLVEWLYLRLCPFNAYGWSFGQKMKVQRTCKNFKSDFCPKDLGELTNKLPVEWSIGQRLNRLNKTLFHEMQDEQNGQKFHSEILKWKMDEMTVARSGKWTHRNLAIKEVTTGQSAMRQCRKCKMNQLTFDKFHIGHFEQVKYKSSILIIDTIALYHEMKWNNKVLLYRVSDEHVLTCTLHHFALW